LLSILSGSMCFSSAYCTYMFTWHT
jgi:hypothetical protein